MRLRLQIRPPKEWVLVARMNTGATSPRVAEARGGSQGPGAIPWHYNELQNDITIL